MGDVAGAECIAGAAAVLDEELFAQGCTEIVRHDAGDEIDGACGDRRHDDFHRPVRIGLRPQRQCAAKEQQRRAGRAHSPVPDHGLSSPSVLTIGDHLARSALITVVKSAGVPPSGALLKPLQRGFQFRRLQPIIDRRVELFDDRLRRMRRRQQPGPAGRDEIRKSALDHGRHVGQLRDALWRGDGKRAQPAGLDERQQHAGAFEGHLHVAGDHVGDRRSAALVRHMHDVDAGPRLEHFADQMRQYADAAGGKVHLARIGLGIGDQLLHGIRRHRRIDHEDVGAFADQRDRVKACQRIVAGIGMQQRRDDQPAGAGIEQRIAVWRGFGRVLRADRIAGAGAVFDHEAFAQRRLQIVRRDPRNDVDRAARRRRHDDFYGPARIILSLRRADCQRGAELRREQHRLERADHVVPPVASS